MLSLQVIRVFSRFGTIRFTISDVGPGAVWPLPAGRFVMGSIASRILNHGAGIAVYVVE
jgi:hypothetical protein